MGLVWLLVLTLIACGAWLVVRGSARTTSSGSFGHLPGPGTFEIEVVGESHYQGTLENICGGRSEDGANKIVEATIILESNNPHDNKAVRIDIDGQTVGYLPRESARVYRRKLKKAGYPLPTCTCFAVIRGGWDRGGDDRGYFGVRLDLPTE
jgi:HIRAN domain